MNRLTYGGDIPHEELMLELSLSAESESLPEISLRAPSLCVSGGAVRIAKNLSAAITYSRGIWAYRGQSYRMLAVTGNLYLIFGIAREPTIVSHPIDHLHFIGPVISTHGVAIAKFSEHQSTWHGLLRPMWWVSMRIVTSDFLEERADSTSRACDQPTAQPSNSQRHRLSPVACTTVQI